MAVPALVRQLLWRPDAQAASGLKSRAAIQIAAVETAVEIVALGSVLVLAVLTRLPNLLVIPAFTDEMEEVALSLAVLGWVLGKQVGGEELSRLFSMRVGRRLDRQGYVRFQNWRIYGERGVAGRRAMAWLSEEYLTIEFEEAALAQYSVKYRSGLLLTYPCRSTHTTRKMELPAVPAR